MTARPFRFRRHRPRGFTLVELAVVIAMLAVLAVLSVPAMQRALSQSRAVNCAANQRQIGAAILLYTAEHDGTFPPVALPEIDTTYRWARLVMPYLGSKEHGTAEGNVASQQVAFFICPLDDVERGDKHAARCSYGLNFAVQSGDLTGVKPPVRVMTVSQPADTVLMGDRWIAANTVNYSVGLDAGRSGNFHPDGRSNYLFVDGHVESLTKKDLTGASAYRWDFP